MLETILGIIVVVSFLLFIFTISYNKFQLAIIKIDKAEEDIDLYLQKKVDLLNRTRPIIKKEIKLKEFLEDLEQDMEEMSHFEKHNLLKVLYNELFKVLDENEKLLKSDTLIAILEDLNINEENIIGAIKFYNDTVVEYNRLIASFPALIVAFVMRYHKKDFYNNEKREIFKILNEK